MSDSPLFILPAFPSNSFAIGNVLRTALFVGFLPRLKVPVGHTNQVSRKRRGRDRDFRIRVSVVRYPVNGRLIPSQNVLMLLIE